VREPVKFGDYYLFERVAVGGMAEVFKAVSYGVEGFERLIALKRVLPNISEDQEFIEMFIDEAKIAVQLNHANIGQIFELGNADRSYFIAMEFVHGKDLRALFDTARRRGMLLNPAMCCHIVKEVCEALEYAHNKRNDRQQPLDLIHRDVSPQNILVSYDGEVKLIDFGIAKAAGKASKTQAGILKGKFGYMSPEQVRGKAIDRRSDLFSMAVVLYELLTLERCFQGESDFSTLEKVRNVDIRRPAEINRAIPPELEAIILRGLSRDPGDRYQSAAEFQDALQKFLYQSGSFYARKDLGAFMRQTFGRELEAEQARMAAYRDYARQHIPEAGRAGPPEVDVDVAQEPFAARLPALSWEQDEVETSVWDRAPSALTALPGDDRGLAPPPPSVGMGLGAAAAHPDPPAFGASARGQLRSTAIDDELAAVPAAANGRVRVVSPTAEVGPALPDLRMAPPDPAANRNSRLWVFLAITLLAVGGAAVAVWWSQRPAEVQTADLTIQAQPVRVQLQLDDQPMLETTTPYTFPALPAGAHQLRVEAPGFLPVTATVDMQAGRAKKLEIALRAQAATSLEITTAPPGARVFIDDMEQPEPTPTTITSIQPGKHRLMISKDGYLTSEYNVVAAEGTLRRVETIKLIPDKVAVTFQPDPANTVITVILADGTRKTLGEGVVTIEGLLNTGLAQVEAEARGYESIKRVLPQYPNRSVTEVLTLEKIVPRVVPPVAPSTRAPSRPPAANPGTTVTPDGRCEGEDCPPTVVIVRPPATDAPPPDRPVGQPEPKGTGKLKLLAVPPARAFIGGKDMGWTPLLEIPLPVGNHTVELVREQEPGAYRKTITVYIEPDQVTFRRVGP